MQHTAISRTALSGRGALEAPAGLRITLAPDCARFSLRVRAEDRAAAATAFGSDLPARIGGLERSGERMAACLGPDEWLLLAPEGEGTAIAAGFASATVTHSLVDVGHRDVGIVLRGPVAEAALGAVCALDLQAMPAGSATRTIFDKAQVVLLKHASEHYRVEVWQSFASHIWDLLAASTREIALDI